VDRAHQFFREAQGHIDVAHAQSLAAARLCRKPTVKSHHGGLVALRDGFNR
jgi:hypothetical protein